ncbi:CubicO group peptidase (beta-lactamase class C family) [Gelidibacter algens]|uniref:CubicO group peptidase (Beta-lactamase class C family) n=1 Tax=Gelidibacter algens TaxID=49280 RepID=A0A1A7R5X8_9FLAO|nr:serine hydrolase [Gelidibacter algens]OBX27271.1 serine hydrolase [Gelidibacter algens]RAJ20914.1 CubicO group peptidase (beta-lactamase class C family) [Gelidibacter algens]
MKTFWLCIAILCFGLSSCSSETAEIEQPQDEAIYFPPLTSETWEMVSISELGWNASQLQPLLEYLALKHSKGFLMLYNGKIVEGTESYMNGHSANTLWYWASAGKTLTSTMAGIAQDKGLIKINTKVSDYLGTGWTSAPLEKENLITCKNLLTMTSGLDDGLGDGVLAENLHYTADAGTRWAYHNVYVKMQDVISKASNQTWNAYFNSQLRDPIGMDGNWFTFENSNVYASTTRSMARFGLMIYAKGKWGNTQIVSENFLTQATTTSQNINEAYGYLWWLNGKPTYHLPQTQLEFPGSLIPTAPSDMYAALGKNDQKLYVVPSKKLVIIRMGEAADAQNFGLSDFDKVLWSKINALIN